MAAMRMQTRVSGFPAFRLSADGGVNLAGWRARRGS